MRICAEVLVPYRTGAAVPESQRCLAALWRWETPIGCALGGIRGHATHFPELTNPWTSGLSAQVAVSQVVTDRRGDGSESLGLDVCSGRFLRIIISQDTWAGTVRSTSAFPSIQFLHSFSKSAPSVGRDTRHPDGTSSKAGAFFSAAMDIQTEIFPRIRMRSQSPGKGCVDSRTAPSPAEDEARPRRGLRSFPGGAAA